jgi:hypothetical protein
VSSVFPVTAEGAEYFGKWAIEYPDGKCSIPGESVVKDNAEELLDHWQEEEQEEAAAKNPKLRASSRSIDRKALEGLPNIFTRGAPSRK